MIRTDDIDSLVMDLAVAANGARSGGLRDPDAAVRLAADAIDTGTELEAMAAPDDDAPRMLREAGRLLATLANRTKAVRLRRARVKAAPSLPTPLPQLDVAELIRRDDAEKSLAGPGFDSTTFEQDEAERIAIQNEMIARRQREHEAQRRAQVAQVEPEPEHPWWRR